MLRHTIFAFIGIYSQLAGASPLISSAGTGLDPRQHVRGAISFDDVAAYCTEDQAAAIKRAFKDLTLLTDAVQGIQGDDPSFKKFFGVGWSGGRFADYYNNIAKNLDLAKQLTLDRESDTKVSVTCQDAIDHCKDGNIGAYTRARVRGVQTMVFCPLFSTSRLFHLTDRARGKPTSDLTVLTSREHVALHELMHVDSAGYQTAINSEDLFFQFDNQNHIGDLKARVSSLDHALYPIYGVDLCSRYAEYKTPPLAATANADSYAWLATAKYFSQTWNTPVSRDGGSGNPTDPDNDQIFEDPDSTCEARSQPLRTDCQQISIPESDDFVNVGGGTCYTNGDWKWCDVYTFGSCQVSVGWDTSANGGKDATAKYTELKSKLEGNFGSNQCAPYAEDVPGACAQPQGAFCIAPYRFCIKRVGNDCKP